MRGNSFGKFFECDFQFFISSRQCVTQSGRAGAEKMKNFSNNPHRYKKAKTFCVFSLSAVCLAMAFLSSEKAGALLGNGTLNNIEGSTNAG